MTTSAHPSSAPASATAAASAASLPTYDRRTIALHWLSAALVFGLWIAGQVIDFFPRGTPRSTVRSLHIAVGVALAVVLVLRLLWRRGGGVSLPPASPGLAGRLAVGGHHLLYGLVAAAVLAGLAFEGARGDSIFGLFKLPSFAPGNRELTGQIGEVHELAANALFFVALGHAAMALWHHLVVKDGVLRRMWPGLGRRSVD